MKKLLRFFVGRLFWIGLILLAQISLIVFACVYIDYIVEENVLIYFGIAYYAIVVVLMGYIINTTANNSYKMAWLFVVGAIPLFGVFLYLMFGNKNTTKRMRRKAEPLARAKRKIPTTENVVKAIEEGPEGLTASKMHNYIEKSSGLGIYNHTQTKYYKIGEEAFIDILSELKKAKHYIFMEYFIIEPGKMWNSILEILTQKVKEGVEVRLIYDDVGCIGTLPMNYPKKMEALGIKCFAFNRFKPLVNVKLNNRDHRKILVIDGHTGFSGGINLADEYINEYEKYGHWKDNAIMLKGRAVHSLTMLFLATWVSNRGGIQELSDRRYDPSYYAEPGIVFPSDGYVQPYGDIPFDDEPIGARVYINLISHAKKYLYIATPYLILDSEMENALVACAKEGVEVVLLTPHIPDKKVVFDVTRSYYKNLIHAGVKVYEYTPGFIHAKMFLCDDLYGTIGTINLDYRSLYLHMENGIYLYKSSCLKDMKEDFANTIAQSEQITPAKFKALQRHKKIYWAILRLFAPLM